MLKTITQIGENDIKTHGVQALSNRPNAPSQYGTGGLSPQKLKEWFDGLAIMLNGKLNEFMDALAGKLEEGEGVEKLNVPGASFIHVPLEENEIISLSDLVASFLNGKFAEVLKVGVGDLDFDDNEVSLQTLINGIGKYLLGFYLVSSLENNKVKLKLLNLDDDELGEAEIDLTVTSDRIADGAVTSPKIADKSVSESRLAEDVKNKIGGAFVSVNVSYDPSDGVFFLTFYDNNGNKTEKKIDVNLESSIINIDDYIADDGTLHLTLTLASGETTDVPLDEVFEGFVKHQKERNRVYGTDKDAGDTSYKIDTPSTPIEASAVVMRNNEGNIIIPSLDGKGTDIAAPLEYLKQTLALAKETLDEVLAIQNEYIGGVNNA